MWLIIPMQRGTMLYNIKDLKWDDEILSLLNIPKGYIYQKSARTQKCMEKQLPTISMAEKYQFQEWQAISKLLSLGN